MGFDFTKHSIPPEEILSGGPPKDAIPAILDPHFVTAEQATFLNAHDVVIGVVEGKTAKAYPLRILNWHEIVNDDIDSVSLAILYCPLTGSGMAWSRALPNNAITTFGVSGLLYNANLIPYDRATNSNWSQMRLQCVQGALSGKFAATYPLVETTWKTWKEMFPETPVIASKTGYSRPYGTYPYGDYKTDPLLIFPVSNVDTRLPRKERIHGIIVGDKTKVFRIQSFPDDIGALHDTFNGIDIIVVGSKDKNFVVSYERKLSDGTLLTFTPFKTHCLLS